MLQLFPDVCSVWDENYGGDKYETFQIMDGAVIALQQFISAFTGGNGLYDGICRNR